MQANIEKQKHVLRVLFITLLIDMIGFGMVFPIIPIIFTDPTSPAFVLKGYTQGAQFFIAGAIIALWGLMQFIAAPILGELSDMYGRKKLLSFGVGILAVSQFLFGLGIGAASLLLLFFARAIAGVAAGNASIAQATIADVTEPKDRAKNFGLIGAAFGMGFILGPFLSGWIADLTHNPAAPFFVAGVLGLVNLFLVLRLLPETNVRPQAENYSFTFMKSVQNIQAAFQDIRARQVYLANFLYMAGFTLFTSFFGVFLVTVFGFSAGATGMTFAAVGLCVAFTQIVILRMVMKKYTEPSVLRITIVTVGICMAVLPFISNIAVFLAFIPLIAVPQGLTVATMTALVSKHVSPEKQGTALGINASLVALASGFAPLISGISSGALGVKMPFIIGAIFIFTAWGTLFAFSRRSS